MKDFCASVVIYLSSERDAMSYEKFKILLWKNWIIQKRNPKAAIFEILFPVLFMLLLAWARTQFDFNFDEIPEGILDFDPFTEFAIAVLPMLLVFSMFYSVNTTIKVSI